MTLGSGLGSDTPYTFTYAATNNRMNVTYYWPDTPIVQSRLARFLIRLAYWIDNRPWQG